MIETVQIVEYVEPAIVMSDVTINGFTISDLLVKNDSTQILSEEDEGESDKVAFESRLEEPSRSDKNWTVSTRGGTNRCINISQGSVLPNCVGYAWGRWTEILGDEHSLSNSHAEKWYLNTSDGYERGQEPRIGAVICWRKGSAATGSDGYGHVAIVEEVYEDGSILISESSYGGDYFTTRYLSKDYSLSGQVFQGFIYIPLEFLTEEEIEAIRLEEELEKERKAQEKAKMIFLKGFSSSVVSPEKTEIEPIIKGLSEITLFTKDKNELSSVKFFKL